MITLDVFIIMKITLHLSKYLRTSKAITIGRNKNNTLHILNRDFETQGFRAPYNVWQQSKCRLNLRPSHVPGPEFYLAARFTMNVINT